LDFGATAKQVQQLLSSCPWHPSATNIVGLPLQSPDAPHHPTPSRREKSRGQRRIMFPAGDFGGGDNHAVFYLTDFWKKRTNRLMLTSKETF
jgi:hypothetical protein